MWWRWRRRKLVLHPPDRAWVFADLIGPAPDAVDVPVVRPPVPVRGDGERS
jgi:hypothetical protein